MNSPKRKRFWIDPAAQLNVLAFVLGVLGLGLLIVYASMHHGLDETARELRRQYIPIEWAHAALRSPFYCSSAMVLLAGGLLTLIWSHRFIGPLLVLTSGMRRVQEGNLKGEVRVRDTDALKEIVNDFGAMQTALRKHVGEDRERLAALQERLAKLAERLGADESARRELDSIREELQKLTAFFQL